MYEKKATLTVNEAAIYTGIGRNTIRRLIAWNMFPVLKVGSKLLIRKEMLDTFLSLNEGKNLRNKFDTVAVMSDEPI